MVRVNIAVIGEEKINLRILNIEKRSADISHLGRPIDDYIRGVFRRQFDSQGRTGESGRWAPLEMSTTLRKRRRNQDPRILRATDQMRQSFTNRSSPDHVFRLTKKQIVVGSRDPKAIFHQRGTKNMPQRKIDDLTARQRQHIVKMFKAHILDTPMPKGDQ